MNGNNLPRAGRVPHGLRDYFGAAEALLMLALARLIITVAPFRWAVLMVRKWPRRAAPDTAMIDPVILSLDRVSRRVPFRAKCFERALAGHWMLGLRGVPTHLHYGIGGQKGRDLEAHVWLSRGDRIILGADEMGAFAEVLRLPADPSVDRG